MKFCLLYTSLFLFGLLLYAQVNSYGHVGKVSSPKLGNSFDKIDFEKNQQTTKTQ